MNWDIFLTRSAIFVEVIVGVCVALWGLWKWRGRAYYRHYIAGRTARHDKLILMLEKQGKAIERIEKQVYPNGGSSILDLLMNLIIDHRMTREAMGFMYWESDALGHVTYVSTTLLDELGCTTRDVLGRSWVGLIHQEDRRGIIDRYKESVDNASMFREEFRFTGCNNEIIKVRAIAKHHKDKEQKLIKSLVKFDLL